MKLEKYPVISDTTHSIYEFISNGPNGNLKKVVLYHEIEKNIFNLAFGDWDDNQLSINDKARSNNMDMEKVLATVAFTVVNFMKYHPNASIFVKGSTTSRTRLYQIGINNNLKEINKMFHTKGLIDHNWEFFQSKKNYKAFLLSAKKKS